MSTDASGASTEHGYRFRHVVMFRWTPESTAEQRDAAIAALTRFGKDMADLCRFRLGADAGIAEGNFDAVAVVDFASEQDYRTYATDPAHQRLIAEHIKPILAARAAVQHVR